MTSFDLGPAAEALTAVVLGVDDDQLDAPTPCPDHTVADLLHHVEGLGLAFAHAARKEPLPDGVDPAPVANADDLDPEWRTVIPARLASMAAAWSDPSAWTGTTSVGGVEQPGEMCGSTGLDELVVHGWDLARATGQSFEPAEQSVAGALAFVEAVNAQAPNGVPGLFGPPTAVPDGATPFERLLALTGRDPGWTR